MTTPETAWTEAMKYENRHDPYRFFDELRKTPVVQVADNVYVVTGYRELLTLAHDPAYQLRHHEESYLGETGGATLRLRPVQNTWRSYGREPSLIVSDPPKHDKLRRQVMRHFAPPHSPDVIPKMETDIQQLCNELLDKDKDKGENRIDIVDDYAYPVPVAVICKILGVPLKDEPTFHGWIFDFMAGTDMGPERRDRRRAGPLQQKGADSHGGDEAVHGGAGPGILAESPARGAVQDGERSGRPGRGHDVHKRPRPTRCCCSSPVTTRRSTPSPTAC